MQINGHIEFTITERTPDRVDAEMPIQDGILNPFGTVHAGATLWLADVTATVLVLKALIQPRACKDFRWQST